MSAGGLGCILLLILLIPVGFVALVIHLLRKHIH